MQHILWESTLKDNEDTEDSSKIYVWKEMFHFTFFPVMANVLKEVYKP